MTTKDLIKKSLIDKNEYKHKTLSNGLRVLLVSNPEFKTAALSVSVPVGSYDEPSDFPGIAHFLEHMLFMGTKKYPSENALDDFTSTHNGYSNAYTANESTVYYCCADSDSIKELLDIFGNFFISPLFKKGAVQREVGAVDSEYLNSLNSPSFYYESALKEFMKKGISESFFNCGNKETLKKDNIWVRVTDFWKEKYTAEKMIAVICGKESIEELEKLSEIYNNVPIHQTNTFDKKLTEKKIFDEKFYQKLIKVKPIDESSELRINFTLSELFSTFKKNPLGYIDFVLCENSPKSLISVLKKNKLAFNISLSDDLNSNFSLISIIISLTEKGVQNYSLVLSTLINYLKNFNISKEEYFRLSKISTENFNFKPNEIPVDLTSNLADSLLKYPLEYALSYDYTYEEYDEKLLYQLKEKISDYSKWIIMLVSNDFDKESTEIFKDKFYNVEYSIHKLKIDKNPLLIENKLEDIEDKFLEDIKLIKSEEIVNQGEFEIFESDSCTRLYKLAIKENSNLDKIFYVFDDSFNSPSAQIKIILKNDDILNNFVGSTIFFKIVENAFTEKYSRILKNYHVEVSVKILPEYVKIIFEGFSEKIPEIIDLFFIEILVCNYDRFDVVKEDLIETANSILASSPFYRLLEVFKNSCIIGAPSTEEILEELKDFPPFYAFFKKDYNFDVIATGNIDYKNVEAIYNTINHYSKVFDQNKNLPKNNIKLFPLPISYENKNISFITQDQNNHLLGNFFISGDSYKEIAISRLIGQCCSELFFNQLRTNEELGYVVKAGNTTIYGKEWLIFYIQSTKDVAFLEKRISKFIFEFKESLFKMTEEVFESFKSSVISYYKEPLINIEELSEFVYSQYLKEHFFERAQEAFSHKSIKFDINFNKNIIEELKLLKLEDLTESKIFDTKWTIFSKNK